MKKSFPLHVPDSAAFGEAISKARPYPPAEAYREYLKDPARAERPDDTHAMKSALRDLQERLIEYERPTEHQLKIGQVNYYPNTGTIVIDGVKGAKKGLSPDEALDLIKRNSKGTFQPKI